MLQQEFDILTLCSVLDYTAGMKWPYCSQNPSLKYHAAPIGMDVDVKKKKQFPAYLTQNACMGKLKPTTRISDAKNENEIIHSLLLDRFTRTARNPCLAGLGNGSMRCSCSVGNREPLPGVSGPSEPLDVSGLPDLLGVSGPLVPCVLSDPPVPWMFQDRGPPGCFRTPRSPGCFRTLSYLPGVRVDGDIVEGGDVAPGGILCKAKGGRGPRVRC